MKFWILLAFLAVFVAGGAMGFVASRRISPPERGHRGDFNSWVRAGDPFGSDASCEEVYVALNLSESQRGMINHLLSTREKRVREISASLSDISLELRAGIFAVLTPEQETVFARIQEERREREIAGQVTQEIASLKGDLELTAVEEAALRPVLLDYVRAKRELFQADEPREKRAAREKELRKTRNDRIERVLPPEKFKKYLEVKEERGRRGWGRDRKPPAPLPAPQ